MTAGNVHDSQERDTLLLGDEDALYADAAYSSKATRNKLTKFGINDQVQRKGYRNKPLSCADQLRNKLIAVTRAGGERPFAIYEQHYGLARTRFMGLAKNVTFYGLAAIAANLRKGAKFLTLYGLPCPASRGEFRQKTEGLTKTLTIIKQHCLLMNQIRSKNATTEYCSKDLSYAEVSLSFIGQKNKISQTLSGRIKGLIVFA